MKRVLGSSRRPRVVLIAFDFGEYCNRLARTLAGTVDLLLLLPESEVHAARAASDIAVRLETFHKPRLRQPFDQIRMCLDLLRRIRRFRPDVIHLQQGHFWFNLFLRSVRTPVVLTIHDLKPHVGDRGGIKTPELIMNLAFRRADRVILHAERMRNDAIARNISPNLIDVIPHVAIGSELRVQPIFEEDHLILFFGRIWPYKGLEYLIRAEPFISSRVPDVKFVIAGEGEDFSRYRALMVHPERFVVHNEFVSNEKRAELFARAAIVVLPYIEASQSGVVPVAYSFSKPVVATTVGGLPEVVEDGRTGYLVPPGDELALADAVVRLLSDASVRRQFGKNGRLKLEREWSPEAVAEKTVSVYQVALGNAASNNTERG